MGREHSHSIVVCLAVVAALGCGRAPDERAALGATRVIKDIRLEGVTVFDEDELLQYTHMRETGWWPWGRRWYFNEAAIPVDRKRIEALYHAHGYYDAEVVEIRPEPRGDDGMDLTVIVREGEPTRVREMHFHWPEGPPRGPQDPEADPDVIESYAELAPDETFAVDRLNGSVVDIRLALQHRGYALAEVEDLAEVDRDDRVADVFFTVRPGPYAHIGDIRFEGLDMAPEELVAVEVDYAPGRRYSPLLIRRIEQSVYALDVFRSVVVMPDSQLGADGRLDLVVRVSEAPPQSLQLGVGFGFEPRRWEERVSMRFVDRNFFGELTRFELRGRAGWAQIPSVLDPRENGPIARLEPSFTKKGLLEKRLVWTLAPAFELGIEEGYQFYTPTNRVGVSRFFFARLHTDLSHNFRFVDFFNTSSTLRKNRTLLGRGFRDPYFVTYVEADVNLHLTDSVLEPRNGVVLGTTYDIAGGALGGDFDFHRIRPSIRGYWTPVTRFQVAARAVTGLIVPYGADPGAPIDLKFYLGGAESVRGFGLRRLAPQVYDCEDGECRGVPVGGDTMVLGNLELRFLVARDVTWAVFGDVGDVQRGDLVYRPEMWSYTTGTGARYDSPVGKFRLDFGYRLNEEPRFVEEARWAFHLGLGESF